MNRKVGQASTLRSTATEDGSCLPGERASASPLTGFPSASPPWQTGSLPYVEPSPTQARIFLSSAQPEANGPRPFWAQRVGGERRAVKFPCA